MSSTTCQLKDFLEKSIFIKFEYFFGNFLAILFIYSISHRPIGDFPSSGIFLLHIFPAYSFIITHSLPMKLTFEKFDFLYNVIIFLKIFFPFLTLSSTHSHLQETFHQVPYFSCIYSLPIVYKLTIHWSQIFSLKISIFNHIRFFGKILEFFWIFKFQYFLHFYIFYISYERYYEFIAILN